MAEAINFDGANMILRAPLGSEEVVKDLHTYTNGKCSVSCWQLSPVEVAEISRTGVVFLSVFSGCSQPPVFVGDEESVRRMVVDFGGIWKRSTGR